MFISFEFAEADNVLRLTISGELADGERSLRSLFLFLRKSGKMKPEVHQD